MMRIYEPSMEFPMPETYTEIRACSVVCQVITDALSGTLRMLGPCAIQPY